MMIHTTESQPAAPLPFAPTPRDLTTEQLRARFGTDAQARAYLQNLRWPAKIVCLHCKQDDVPVYTIAPNPARKVRLGLLECSACHKQFTVTVGTFFEDLHLPLDAWLCAWYMASSLRGVGALALQRCLGLPHYQTARAMLARIRDSGYPHVVSRRGSVRVAIDFDEAMRACLRGKPTPALVAVPAQAGTPALAMPSLRRLASAP
jgi:hypothetical protein